jgi:glycosyltransferase involved in cell wall biosynthesis
MTQVRPIGFPSETAANPVATPARPRLMAVVPAFNEEKNVATVLDELSALELPNCDLDYVIIDDGSRDQTRAVARAHGASVVSLPYNMGIGIAVQTGFKYALARGADLVAQVDGDCQHVPSELAKLLEPIRADEADVVIGTRFGDSTVGGLEAGLEATTFTRWLVGRALALNIRILTGMRITDTTSGFRLYNRRAAQFISENYPDDYPEVEILVLLARHGFRVREVNVRMRPRMNGHSSINWHRAIYYVFKVTLASMFSRVRRVK